VWSEGLTPERRAERLAKTVGDHVQAGFEGCTVSKSRGSFGQVVFYLSFDKIVF
jgi:hypothetical protein